jgi:hypothetical protein
MFKNATDIKNSAKYRKVLKAALKRMKKVQSARNARDNSGGGTQTSDVIQSLRYFADYKYADVKQPGPILLVGKKTVVNRIADDLLEGPAPKKGKDAPKEAAKEPTKKAKGICFWHEPTTTFHFLVKGAVKLPDLVKLLKKSGFKDRVKLGEAGADDEARAAASEKDNEALEGSIPEEAEEEVEEVADEDDEEVAPYEAGAPVLRLWRDSKEKVDRGINQLCDRLRKTGDKALSEAADKLTEALTKYKVGLESSLLNYDQAAPEAKAGPRAKLLQFIEVTRQHVEKNDLLIAADDNPFGIAIYGVDTLTEALDRVREAVSS